MSNQELQPIEVSAEEVSPQSNNDQAQQAMQTIDSLVGMLSCATDLAKAVVEAKKQMALANQQVETFVMSLNDKQKEREMAMVSIRALHKELDRVIETAQKLALQPDLTDTKLGLIQNLLSFANTLLQKLPNL